MITLVCICLGGLKIGVKGNGKRYLKLVLWRVMRTPFSVYDERGSYFVQLLPIVYDS